MQARNLLWLLVLLLAIESLVGEFYRTVPLTVLHLTILLSFAFVHGAMRYGTRGIVAFAVICLVVSNIFENMGVATGFPFGPYHYTDALGPKLGYVPLMIGPAYLGVGYLSWVLGTVLVGDVKRGADALSTFATPSIGAFIMVLWDLAMDPSASTLGQWWIWHEGGGFFGVPLQNYLGWYLTVFVFMQIFALYLRARGPRADRAPQPKSYYLQAIAMYARRRPRFRRRLPGARRSEHVDRRDRHERGAVATSARPRRSPPADDDVRRRAHHGDDHSAAGRDAHPALTEHAVEHGPCHLGGADVRHIENLLAHLVEALRRTRQINVRPSLVGAFEEAAGDDLRLDLGRALEDVEDARVAQHAADGVLERKAVAAVDL